MMRGVLMVLFCLMGMLPLLSQHGKVAQHVASLRSSGEVFQPHAPLLRAGAEGASVRSMAEEAEALVLADDVLDLLRVQRPKHVVFSIPHGERILEIELYQVDPFNGEGLITIASSGAVADVPYGVHYRGVVAGSENSLATISIFDQGIMGMIDDGAGTLTLGRLDDRTDGMHILFDASSTEAPPASCVTIDDGGGYAPEMLLPPTGARNNKCVRLYWEVDHDIHLNKGGLSNTVVFITGLFHQSATLFSNEGIQVMLSQLHVWDVPDPFTSGSTQALLQQFGQVRTSFNGDLAHLIGFAGGGGMAWLNGICHTETAYRMAYSGITSSYQGVPSYSWSVQVVTHEQGHLLGSRHTHACAWNGNDTPIDGCGPAAGLLEGDCAPGPVPPTSVGGTIMSYCHLGGNNIQFGNGFGPQPRNVIQNTIAAADCISSCGPATCSPPADLLVNDLTPNSVAVSWSAVEGAVGYGVEHRAVGDSDWTAESGISGTDHELTGLVALPHELRVIAICADGSNVHSETISFTPPALIMNTTEHEDRALKVFPNPVKDRMQLEVAGWSGAMEYVITDVLGRMMDHGSLTIMDGAIPMIETGMLAPGVHTLVLRQTSGERHVRFVKE